MNFTASSGELGESWRRLRPGQQRFLQQRKESFDRYTSSLAFPTKVAPTLTFGWGNAIPRSGRHFAFTVEIGAAYNGAPKFNLANSSVCNSDGKNCPVVANYPQFNTNVIAVSNEVVNDIKPMRFYPILNLGITYKF